MSIYKNSDYLEMEDNVRIFVDRDHYLYSIVLMIREPNEALHNDTLTFIASNQVGVDKATVRIVMKGGNWIRR